MKGRITVQTNTIKGLVTTVQVKGLVTVQTSTSEGLVTN